MSLTPPFRAFPNGQVPQVALRTRLALVGASTRSTAVMFFAVLFGCAATDLAEKLQPDAIRVAQQRGATDLGCSAATAEVTNKKTIEAPQTTGWHESPRQAEYTIGVSGCGKNTSYLVTCDKLGVCNAAPVSSAKTGSAPRTLADDLEPNAIQAAQQRGSKELECPAATATVTRKQTIEEAQTTGWYESPYRAGYAVAVTGCGKQTVYAVECDKRGNGCATGRLQQAATTGSQRTLADELQPLAVQAAQQIGSQDLQCPDVTTEVTHKDTIEESQTTGWYDLPYRTLYAITTTGCGKQTKYLVACNNKEKRCTPSRPLTGN
jgi:hypothetical protein